MSDSPMYIVRKIEQSEDGKYTAYAQEADESKKKRRKVACPILDPTSFYVGQKVRLTLDDAS